MARILFNTFGSFGDLYPYLALGRELRSRNHVVTIATSASFGPKIEAEGLHFHAVRPDVDLGNRELLDYLFHRALGSQRVVTLVASVVRESYEDILEPARRADVIVTHPITYAGVIAARKLGMPWISTVLAPISLLSADDPPVLPPAPWLHKLHGFAPGLLKAILAFGKRQAISWVKPVIKLAREEGLGDYGNPVFEGSFSPELVLALFSRLIGEPQPDWPPQTVMTGFPFYDGPGSAGTLAPELEEFFAAGPPPVVFTLGSSAVGAAGRFYRDSLRAAHRLGVRALFLTGSHQQDLPATLPAGMMAWQYAPHGQVFPRAAVVVHQGGVGTLSQAMRSGRPMLTVPFAHDQFDNAERVRRLGSAETLYRSRYSASRAEEKLRALTSDPAYADAAARVRRQILAENGPVAAADAIEAVLRVKVQQV